MSKDYPSIIKSVMEYTAELKKAIPDTMKSFYELGATATKDSVLDKKTKEMTALAIAVTARCDGCIGFHVKTLKELGTTREELCEVLSMCIYMGGGPSVMYAADALRAFDQF